MLFLGYFTSYCGRLDGWLSTSDSIALDFAHICRLTYSDRYSLACIVNFLA